MLRTWDARNLQPHGMRAFKRPHDPRFAAKFMDIVGLYVDPPAQAVVLFIDEKSQIPALDRTNPPLPSHRLRRRDLWQLRPDCGSSAGAAARRSTITSVTAPRRCSGR